MEWHVEGPERLESAEAAAAAGNAGRPGAETIGETAYVEVEEESSSAASEKAGKGEDN